MRKILITFCLLIGLASQAQIAPLLEHVWRLEKVIVDDEEIIATQSVGSSELDDWAHIYFHEENFSFVAIHPLLEFSDDNSSFSIIEMFVDFGSYHFAPSTDAFGNFIISGDVFTDWNNPFSYSFRNESELLYLDITNANGDVATFFTTTLSNTNFEKVELNIYPNPTSNLLHIEASQTDISRVEIFDVQGKRVMQVSPANLSEIDVSQLTNGMYFLKLSTSNGELTRKFVKK